MGTQILAVLVVFVALSQIGCSNDKPQTPAQMQSMVQSCMWDQTGACQARAKAIMENPQYAAQINQVAQTSLANGGTGAVAVGSSGPYALLPRSITESQIQQQYQRVQAAMAADRNNPRSLYYDPAQAARAPSSAGNASPTLPASVTPAGRSEPASEPTMVSAGGIGEVTR
jgi:hypothetical protein